MKTNFNEFNEENVFDETKITIELTQSELNLILSELNADFKNCTCGSGRKSKKILKLSNKLIEYKFKKK